MTSRASRTFSARNLAHSKPSPCISTTSANGSRPERTWVPRAIALRAPWTASLRASSATYARVALSAPTQLPCRLAAYSVRLFCTRAGSACTFRRLSRCLAQYASSSHKSRFRCRLLCEPMTSAHLVLWVRTAPSLSRNWPGRIRLYPRGCNVPWNSTQYNSRRSRSKTGTSSSNTSYFIACIPYFCIACRSA